MSAPGGRRLRLSWQLWASHFAVVVITLVALVGALVGLSGLWLLRQGFVLRQPAADAQVVAVAVGNLLRRDPNESHLSVILSEIQSGGLKVPVGPFEGGRGQGFGGPPAAFRPDFEDADYLAIVGSGGLLLAASDPTRFPAGSSFSAAGADEVLRRALSGERDTARLSVLIDGGGAVGAFPIVDPAAGQPTAAVVVAKRSLPPRDPPHLLGYALAAFGLATTLVLMFSSVFALLFSGLAAYLLARRISGRLERLSAAADGLAHGDLARRVSPGRPDEVGQLGQHFNEMAERLQATIAALEVEKARAEEALRTRRELLANVSHELRTPLALIRGHVESLTMGRTSSARPTMAAPSGYAGPAGGSPAASGPVDSGAFPPDRARDEYLLVIEREVERLERLINDLFALATAEAGQLPLELETLGLDQVAADVVAALAPIAHRERRVTLLHAVEPGLPAVRADRQRLSQILGNLLRNALRYTPAGGLISVSAR